MASAKTSRRKRQTRALIVLAGVAFVGMLVLDGLTQLNSSNDSSNVVGLVGTNDNIGGGAGAGGNPNYERGLGGRSSSRGVAEQAKPRGFVRKLVGSIFDTSRTTTNNDVVVAPSHRLYDNQEPTNNNPTNGVYDPNYNRNSNPIVAPSTATMDGNNQNKQQQQQRAIPLLHTFPLLPKHALQHRQRRELMDARKPIPLHLVEGQDDELYRAPHHQRRRMYPMATMENPFAEGAEMKVVDARLVQRRMAGDAAEEEDVDETTLYETGAIYQGYGTHYLDLWVGSPPQRQSESHHVIHAMHHH